MGKLARYTTYREGELEATLRRLDPQGQHQHPATGLGNLVSPGTGRSRSGLVISHCCNVAYPDGATGTCRYTRGGPAWHIFRFEHTGRNGKTTPLPVQYETERIGNTVAAIEGCSRKLAPRAFTDAVKREQREHFRRAVPPFEHSSQNAKCPQAANAAAAFPQMKVKEAKEAAGKYALCLRVGCSLLPTGQTWDTLDEAAAAWRDGGNSTLVIGCCCRWKRRWEEPEFNPLRADPAYPQHSPSPTLETGQEGLLRASGTLSVDETEPIDSEEAIPALIETEFPPLGDSDAPPEAPDTSPDPLYEQLSYEQSMCELSLSGDSHQERKMP